MRYTQKQRQKRDFRSLPVVGLNSTVHMNVHEMRPVSGLNSVAEKEKNGESGKRKKNGAINLEFMTLILLMCSVVVCVAVFCAVSPTLN